MSTNENKTDPLTLPEVTSVFRAIEDWELMDDDFSHYLTSLCYELDGYETGTGFASVDFAEALRMEILYNFKDISSTHALVHCTFDGYSIVPSEDPQADGNIDWKELACAHNRMMWKMYG